FNTLPTRRSSDLAILKKTGLLGVIFGTAEENTSPVEDEDILLEPATDYEIQNDDQPIDQPFPTDSSHESNSSSAEPIPPRKQTKPAKKKTSGWWNKPKGKHF